MDQYTQTDKVCQDNFTDFKGREIKNQSVYDMHHFERHGQWKCFDVYGLLMNSVSETVEARDTLMIRTVFSTHPKIDSQALHTGHKKRRTNAD